MYLSPVFNDLFVFNLPQTISWIICGVPIFFGNVKRQDRGNMARDLRYLAAVITHEFHAIGELIRLRTRLSEINGYTNNICELLETIEDMKKKKDQGSINTGNSIKFENVDLLTPDGKKVLAKSKFSKSKKYSPQRYQFRDCTWKECFGYRSQWKRKEWTIQNLGRIMANS